MWNAEGRYQEILDLHNLENAEGYEDMDLVATCYCEMGEEEKMLEAESLAIEGTGGFRLTGAYLSNHKRRIRQGKFTEATGIYETAWENVQGNRGQTGVGDINHIPMILAEGSAQCLSGDTTGGLDTLNLLRDRRDSQGLDQIWLGYFLVESGDVDTARQILVEMEKEVQGRVAPFLLLASRCYAFSY